MPRKKWTEPEELSLIDKYSQMQSDGSLVRSRTRETKFRPIAAHVNAAHHAADPLAFPFLWSWKDVATKVQNMRHQYLLVKQKLLSAPNADADADAVEWSDGLSLWPNFLRYKEVFGDVPLKPPADPFAADGDLGVGLRFDCCEGEGVDDEEFDYEDAASIPATATATQRPKRKKRPAWSRLAEGLALLRERDAERRAEEMERQEAERRRREEELEWEVRIERRRLEWRERIYAMVNHHRVEMESIHGRIIQEQQSVIGQLLGVFSHCPGAGAGIGSLHQMDGLVQEENRVDGDGQEDEDQFIVE